MNLDPLRKRFDALGHLRLEGCPRCRAIKNMTDEELDAAIQALESGQVTPALPEPSPTCPDCQRAEAMCEEELDGRLAGLLECSKDLKKFTQDFPGNLCQRAAQHVREPIPAGVLLRIHGC